MTDTPTEASESLEHPTASNQIANPLPEEPYKLKEGGTNPREMVGQEKDNKKPLNLDQEIVSGMVDRIVEIHQDELKQPLTTAEIAELRASSFVELNQKITEFIQKKALVEEILDHVKVLRPDLPTLTPEEVAQLKTYDLAKLKSYLSELQKRNPQQPVRYVEGSDKTPTDLSKDKTVEELLKPDKKDGEESTKSVKEEYEPAVKDMKALRDEWYGENGIVSKSVKEMADNPEKFGMTAEDVKPGEGKTVANYMDSVLAAQMSHLELDYRRLHEIPLNQELSDEQKTELETERQQKTDEFKKQTNTLQKKLINFGIDIATQPIDFGTFMQMLLSFDGYSHGNAQFFPEHVDSNQSAVGITAFKEMIDWKSGKTPTEAKVQWMKAFGAIAKHLPEDRRRKLSNINDWPKHTDDEQIMKDMEQFYDVLVMNGAAAQNTANQAFAEGLKDPETGFGEKFLINKNYVSKELITCVEMLGRRRDYFNNFFGSTGVK